MVINYHYPSNFAKYKRASAQKPIHLKPKKKIGPTIAVTIHLKPKKKIGPTIAVWDSNCPNLTNGPEVLLWKILLQMAQLLLLISSQVFLLLLNNFYMSINMNSLNNHEQPF